ncbi:hypothetical protein [Algibacillus agarilyticus]|uniref:hypothetical protein n=1 Tax=Algibacillus agarilyticus TaxID=2234133 RepID=UPI000DD09328|nr:hypothetical protein [Algibacillus agarilyticus]
MDIKFHRLKVGGNDNGSFGYGASWLIGLGILMAAGSITIFSYVDTAPYFLIGFVPLIFIFYLSTNFPKLRIIILLLSGSLSLFLGIISIPDFLSNNTDNSGIGLYHGLLSLYFLGVFASQFKNSNNTP